MKTMISILTNSINSFEDLSLHIKQAHIRKINQLNYNELKELFDLLLNNNKTNKEEENETK